MQPRFPVEKLAALRNPFQDLFTSCQQPGSQPMAPLAAPQSLAWGYDPLSVPSTDCPGAVTLPVYQGLTILGLQLLWEHCSAGQALGLPLQGATLGWALCVLSS